ncbi:MAG: transposase [Bacteroidetes bacterium]|nr:transposase [Bacteroidota bacterium]
MRKTIQELRGTELPGTGTPIAAIDNGRILSIRRWTGEFSLERLQKQGAKGTMKLSGEEFIRRFLLHILPKGFCKIRYYGIFASRIRKTMLHQCKKPPVNSSQIQIRGDLTGKPYYCWPTRLMYPIVLFVKRNDGIAPHV